MNNSLLYLADKSSSEDDTLSRLLRILPVKRTYLASIDKPHASETCLSALSHEAELAATLPPGMSAELLHQQYNSSDLTAWDAINWFFSIEEMGIIFQGDQLPDPEFLQFCDWALSYYHTDQNIWQVGSMSHGFGEILYDGYRRHVSSAALPLSYCWASWRDRWRIMRTNSFYLAEKCRAGQSLWNVPETVRDQILRQISIDYNKPAPWQPFWSAVILSHRGFCAIYQPADRNKTGDTFTEKAIDPSSSVPSYPTPRFDKPLNALIRAAATPKFSTHASMAIRCRKFLKAIRHALHNAITRILFAGCGTIIVASTGRSGSTILFDSITESIVKHRFGLDTTSRLGRNLYQRAGKFLPRLGSINRTAAPVIKTHDLPPKQLPSRTKIVFIHGDPLESAKSVEAMVLQKGKRWLENHLYNLNSDGHISEIYQKDILNFEKQMTNWRNVKKARTFFVRHQDLWDKVEDLSEYLGFQVRLPNKLPRSPKPLPGKIDHELFMHLRSLMETTEQE